MSTTSFALFETAIGPCGIVWSERGLSGLQLPESDPDATRARIRARHPAAIEAPLRALARGAAFAIRAHLAGKTDALDRVPLDYAAVPLFHKRVYEALRCVLPGQTVGYGELAARIGSPGAARAVGQAVGRNPFPIVVPCHRVLAAGGRPGGFSAFGGVATKRAMLAIEGVILPAPRRPATAPVDLRKALAHLRKADPRLARIINRVGPPDIRQAATKSTFAALAESIVYQQLNGKAAETIHGRLVGLFPGKRMEPESLLAATDDALRGAGLSRGKTLALRDLAHKTLDGVVPSIRTLQGLEDEAIVDRLVQVRGIGRWTVEMLLIFRLGRLDVLPVADFGVRHGFKLAYGKREMPAPKELARHGEKWRPYRTLASWYLWRAVDLARKKPSAGRA